MYNVLSQMGAQQGVARGPSPGSEMLIMSKIKSYTHTTHTRIPTFIIASVCLAKQEFYGEVFFYSPLFLF